MKKSIKLLSTLLIITLLLTGCSFGKETDAMKFKKEYENINGETREKDGKKIRTISIDKENPMVYSSAKEVIEMMNNKESFVVYFGFKDCPWCRSVVEQLIKAAKDENLEKVYYVDVKDIRDVKELVDGEVKTTSEGTKYYQELLTKMDSVLEDYELTNDNEEKVSTGEKRIYAPNIISVVRGNAQELETGIPSDLEDPYEKLTSKMKKETYNSFKCSVKCVLKASTSCDAKTMC